MTQTRKHRQNAIHKIADSRRRAVSLVCLPDARRIYDSVDLPLGVFSNNNATALLQFERVNQCAENKLTLSAKYYE